MTTIFLHGFSGDSSSLLQFIAACGFNSAQAVDMPEFGSNHRTYEPRWPDYSRAVMESIQDQAGAGPFRVIGHSQGAMVAYALAIHYPELVREIVLLCPPVYGSWLGTAFLRVNNSVRKVVGDERAVSLHKKPSVVKTISRLSRVDDWPDGAFDRFHQVRIGESERYTASMLRLTDMLVDFPEVYSHTSCRIPAAILPADNDRLVTARDMVWFQTRLTGAVTMKIKGGHVAPLIFPDETAAAIHRALDEAKLACDEKNRIY